MYQRKTLRLLSAIITVSLLCVTSAAQPIHLPQHTIEGRLDNGLRYVIKNNPVPRNIIEFRLVMNVGSIQENDNQKGAAHFLEHMTFAGTKHFPNNGMVDYFERQGMKYGRDINAFTGFDKTIYWFTVPIDSLHRDVIDTTLCIMNDLLTSVTFDAQRTKRERGVILEELRGYDTHDDFYSLKIGNNRYSHRLPLGNAEDISSIDRGRLIDFYHHWYVPQLATIVAVGNFDNARMERKIRKIFGAIPRREAEGYQKYPLEYARDVTMMHKSDNLSKGYKLEIIVPHTTALCHDIGTTVDKYRRDMLVSELNSIFDERDIQCDVSDSWYLADKYHFVFSVNAPSRDSLLMEISAISSEINHIASDGIPSRETQRLVAQSQAKVKANTETSQSSDLCDDFVDYVTVGDRRIYQHGDADMVKKGINATTSRLLRDKMRDIVNAMKRTRLLALTTSSSADTVSSHDIMSAWNKGKGIKVLPFVKKQRAEEDTPHYAIPQVLLCKHPSAAGHIASRRRYDDLQIDEIVLDNGAHLLFRPTTDDADDISLVAFGRGGNADIDNRHYNRLKDAVGYVDMGNLKKISSDEYNNACLETGLSMSVGSENYWHQVLAASTVKYAQVLMNAVYEKMTAPGVDTVGFEDVRRQELDSYGKQTLLGKMMQRDVDRTISNRIDSLMGNSTDLYRSSMTKSDIEALNIDTMTAYYKRLFSDPSRLTIFFTGNYKLSEIEEMAVNTFSRLKTLDASLPLNNTQYEIIKKDYCERFDSSIDSQTAFNYIYAGNYTPSLRHSLTFKLMRDLLQDRMLKYLRGRDNIVYSPYSDLYYHGAPMDTYYFWLSLSVKNENAGKLQNGLIDIIKELQSRLVDAAELEKMKRSFVVTKRQHLSDVAPSEWRKVIPDILKNGETLDDFDHYDHILDTITPLTIRDAFREYINTEHYILIYKGKEIKK